MLEKIVLKIAGWLLQFTTDWTICAESTYEKLCYLAQEGERIKSQAVSLVATAEQLVEENKRLHTDYERLREDAVTIVVEEARAENDRLRRELGDAQNAYCALLEEMEELRND